MDPQNVIKLALSPSTSNEEEKAGISVLPGPVDRAPPTQSPPERLRNYLKLIDL